MGQSSLGLGEPELWSIGHTDQGGSTRPKSPECMEPQAICQSVCKNYLVRVTESKVPSGVQVSQLSS